MIVRSPPFSVLSYTAFEMRPTTTHIDSILELNLTADYQHDAVLDYYGRRLATCSSDKTIKIFEVEGDTHRLTETLKGLVSYERTSSFKIVS